MLIAPVFVLPDVMVVRVLRHLGAMARVRQAATEREVLHQPCVMACVRLGASRVVVLLVVLSVPLGASLQVLVVPNALSVRQANMQTRKLRQHVLFVHMAVHCQPTLYLPDI